MKANSAIMEADSTTIENDCYEFYDASEVERESSLMDDLLKYHGFFHRVVSPLLKSGQVPELLEWMKETNLIPPSVKCSNDLPGCGLTTWTPTRVVDKFQWQCNSCKQKLPIRENSFFKNLFCSLGICFKVILAWCQDIDFANVAVALGIKKQLVNYIYEKIERVVSSSSHSPGQFGGPGSVVLVELYPDSIGDLHSTSDTSKSDTSPKPHTKILCIADTKQVPVRYWLHAVTGNVLVQTENNNTKLKKISLCDEVLGVLEKLVLPGGYCAVGGGVHYTALLESLQASGIFEGVKSFSDLSSQTNGEVRSFIMCDIWKSAAILCEAAQDLPRNKMQSYLTCCAWRREVEPRDTFQCLIQLIAEYDHSIAPKKSYKKKK